MKIICVGGGLTGLSAAYHLQEQGHDVTVYEKESEPGGLCRTKKIQYLGEEVNVDIGVHAFWTKPGYWNDWVKEELGIRMLRQTRDAKVYFKGELVPYPFQANLSKLPKEIAYECLLEFIRNTHGYIPYQNFKSWALTNFGSGICEHFIKPYNEKLWGDLTKVSSCWVKNVPVPKIEDMLKEVLGLEDKKWGEGNCEFDYPQRGGIGVIAKELAKRVTIEYNTEITAIDLLRKKLIFSNKLNSKFAEVDLGDIVINTAPLDWLLDHTSLNSMDSFKVRERCNLRNNYVKLYTFILPHAMTNPEHWIYFSQPEIPFYRVSFLHNFPGVCSNKLSVIQAEVAYTDDCVSGYANLTPQGVLTKLIELGIISEPREWCEDVMIVDPAYIIFHNNYTEDMESIHKKLNEQNIYSIGRYGKWHYTSMHDSLQEGKDIAERIG